ncbi:MAG TPA: mechanosensitive ion channel domain-containing protein [Polyangiaceae bacterium]|nr:mechanosensitive ion channel domain-containing protein [Polyangiaceae bacterium]
MFPYRRAATLRRVWAGSGAVLLLSYAAPAAAQDVQDLGRLIHFIRWGGVAADIPVIIAASFLIRVLDGTSDRFAARFPNRRPTIQKVQTTARFFIYIALLMVVITLGVQLDATALTVIGGAMAFAVGFSLRDLVASFIAGITIMFDRPFQVGDRVSYGGQYGDIIKIGLRSVRMNTLDHNIITIPNNKVFTEVAASANYGALEMQVAMDFYVGLDQDVNKAAEIIHEACLTSPYVFLGQPIPLLARQLLLRDHAAFHLKARPYVFDCKYEKAFETDVHFRVLEAFRQHAIRPPALLHQAQPAPGEIVPWGAPLSPRERG